MWKVILVEDEIFVRDTIKQLIPWHSSGFTLVGEAGDGTEALELITRHKPDLVISDIIMPEMDGVTLLRFVRQQGLETRFIMLTCMNDFEYAREALELGASGYILKLSMDIRHLEESLNKVRLELERSRGQSRDKLIVNMPAVFDRIWRSISAMPATPVRLELDAMEAGLDNEGIRIGAVCSVLHGGEPLTAELRDWAGRTAGAQIYTDMGISTIFNWSRTPLPLDVLERDYAHRFAHAPVQGLAQLPELWSSLLTELTDEWYGDQEMTGRSTMKHEHAEFLWDTERRLIDAIERGLTEEADKAIRMVWEEMRQRRIPPHRVKQMATHIVNQYRRVANITLDASAEMSVESAISHGQLLTGVRAVIVEDMKRRSHETVPVTDHPEINKILSYIHEHYADNHNGLRVMAEYVKMDENYLSGLFRKKTGESLIQYLQQIRIKQAIRYLETTDLTISEIGQLVGFGNDHYFIKVFKKLLFMTPNEYRKSKI